MNRMGSFILFDLNSIEYYLKKKKNGEKKNRGKNAFNSMTNFYVTFQINGVNREWWGFSIEYDF